MDYKALGNLLFPDINVEAEVYEEKYPKRNLPEGAKVTRFAPSPTGFLHLGGLFAALVSERLAHQSNGVFYLRIEDTDKKREVEGGLEQIVNSLAGFDVIFDEGVRPSGEEVGQYGPYKQSERMNIYKAYVKLLVERGLAYPCFCTEEELEDIRNKQESQKLTPGYYGEWAVHRNFSFEQIKEEIEKGKAFVVRLKSPGSPNNRIVHKDLIKGDIEMPENDQDIVIMKSDGLPTYHFAHAVDDHLMRTTHVIRGDEWLSSVPIHHQLFEILGFEKPKFAHISPILKEDNGGKRKLSKRKDPEASVSYFHEQGFPSQSVIEYLLNLINSNYEEWRRENPYAPYTSFPVDIEKMSVSGSLFDIVKLTDMSKDIIARMSADEVYELSLKWANKYDEVFAFLMEKEERYVKDILSIERGGEKPRKDIAKWSDVKPYMMYFFDEAFEQEVANGYIFVDNITKEDLLNILSTYYDIYDENDDNTIWFDKIKVMAESLGFSKDIKAYKKNPQGFKGHVGDVAMTIRIAVSNRKMTPDLHQVMKVMGKDRIRARLKKAIEYLK